MKRIKLARYLVSSMTAAMIFVGSACAELTDGLVSYWPLDGDFIDYHGANDGLLRGTDTDAVFEDGQLDQGILLDGISWYHARKNKKTHEKSG